MDVKTAAYLAGIIDGEGSLQLDKKLAPKSFKRNYMPRMIITTTCKELNDYLLGLNVGFASSLRTSNPNKNAVDSYSVACGQQVLSEILPQVLDCLVVKRKQAELLLEVLERKTAGTADDEWLESKKVELHALNGRGTPEYKAAKIRELLAEQQAVEASRNVVAAARQAELLSRMCPECGTSMGSAHWLAKFCSNACKLKSWRRAQKQNGAPIAEDPA